MSRQAITEKIMFILNKNIDLVSVFHRLVIKFLFFPLREKMSNYNLTEKGYEQEFVWMARLFWT